MSINTSTIKLACLKIRKYQYNQKLSILNLELNNTFSFEIQVHDYKVSKKNKCELMMETA